MQPAGELGLGLKREALDGQERKFADPVETIRVLDFLETPYVSGPAKNLIEFAQRARHASPVRANVAIATFHRGDGSASNDFTRACQRAGLELHIIQERFPYDPAIIFAMRNLLAAHNPDIIQTHSVKSHFLLRLTRAYRQHRWIAFHHGYTWTNLKVGLYNQLDHWSLPASLRVVTVCQAFAADLERLGVRKDRIAVQHNSVKPFLPPDIEVVAALRQSLRVPQDAKILLNVGRLSREKGQAELIEAVAILRKQSTDRKLHVVFVGDGPDRSRLEHIAAEENVSDCVVFAAYQADVAPYYMLADAMVLSSRTEGSPNVLLEAMAAGLPIVATAVGGVPEIAAAAKAALLVQKKDPISLAQAIAKVLDREDLRMDLSVVARKTAAAYSPETYCDALLSLYQDCMKEAPPGRPRGTDRRSEKSTSSIQNKALLMD